MGIVSESKNYMTIGGYHEIYLESHDKIEVCKKILIYLGTLGTAIDHSGRTEKAIEVGL